MDSQTTAAADPISRENGVNSSSPHQEQVPPAAASVSAEESYETASESEDSSDEKTPMPPTRVLGENPNSEVKKGVATESSDAGDYGVSESDGLDEEKQEAEDAEVVVSGGGSNRDEVLGDGSCSEVENSAVGEDEKETESVVVNPVVGGEEKAEKVDVSDDNDSSAIEPVENSKPVEDEEINAGLKPASVAEKDLTADNSGSDRNTEGVAEDSKPVNAAYEESKAVEEEEKSNADVEEKEVGAVDGLGEPEALEELLSADVAKEDQQGPLDEGGELKPLETEKNEAADASNETGTKATFTSEVESNNGDVNLNPSPDVVPPTASAEDALSKGTEDTSAFSSEAEPNNGHVNLNQTQDVLPPPAIAEDSPSKENENTAAFSSGPEPNTDDVSLNPSKDVVPPSAFAAESEVSETSDVVESASVRKISVESLLPASVSVEKVEPEAYATHIADDDENAAQNELELLDNSGVTESKTDQKTPAESILPASVPVEKVESDANASHVAAADKSTVQDEAEEEDGNASDQQPRVAILDSSEAAKQIIKDIEGGSNNTSFESSRSYQRQNDRPIVSDSDEEVDTDEEGDDKELFDTTALAALLKAATGHSSDLTSQDDSRVFSVDRPAGLGSSIPTLRPVPNRSTTRPTLFNPSELALSGEPEIEMDPEERKLQKQVEDIRVKFLRLIMRLGHTPEDTVASQVLYRLSLAEGIRRNRNTRQIFTIEGAKKKAFQLEEEGKEDLEFSCNILVLGKTGVGKSATINSIFGEEKVHTNAFQAATASLREISGVVDGVKIRIIDTPGLRTSVMDQPTNRKILASIKKYTKKCPPDIVLYVDRLDTQTRDFNDLPMLKSITSALGSSIWFNAVVALTHAASAPPEGPNGSPLSYDVFIAQRSHVVQHSIRQAAGDMRLMNPVALVENHPSCRRNREGNRVLPNGLSWRPQMLLLCYSSKILSEANSLLKLQDPSPAKLFGFRFRSPPLPYLLSTLLQSRPHPKLPSDQGGDNGDSDIDLDDFSDAEDEEDDEYDQLPPFKPLKKSQIAQLTKEQKRAYYDEYDYRVKLLQKKQLKEEIRRLKEMKKRGKSGRDASPYGDVVDDYYDQDNAPAAVPVPLPDMVLPPSFDSDIPTYRYRFLEPTSQLLTRPVLDTHGWDHDCGYDGVSLEESLAIANRFPAAVAVQITKDKKDFNIHLDSSVSAKHGDNGSSLAGFDIQSVGKQLAYILRSEAKFKTLKKNKTAAGVSVTFLGDTVATGLKVEDQLMIGKRLGLVASTGAVRAQGDTAYGANLEARLREKDYPIGQAVSTLGLSLMKWRGDLALGANLQSQANIGRNSKVALRVGLNNKQSGQITIRTSTSEQLQLALVGIIPVALSIYRNIWPSESEYSR